MIFLLFKYFSESHARINWYFCFLNFLQKDRFYMFNHTRFLIVRLSSIGDILHTTTVARTLKHTYPQCHITWIVSLTGAELLTCNPDIDELFVWSREEFKPLCIHGNSPRPGPVFKNCVIFFPIIPLISPLTSMGSLCPGLSRA